MVEIQRTEYKEGDKVEGKILERSTNGPMIFEIQEKIFLQREDLKDSELQHQWWQQPDKKIVERRPSDVRAARENLGG